MVAARLQTFHNRPCLNLSHRGPQNINMHKLLSAVFCFYRLSKKSAEFTEDAGQCRACTFEQQPK
jgi:hypothetical protein